MSTNTDTSSAQVSLIGRVKWFNNKAGYGFITITDGDKSGTDVFVHHTAIEVSSQQYKYLVQGEYVQFKLVHTNGGTHEYQSGGVSGVNGGKLMCETRNELKATRKTYTAPSDSVSTSEPVKKSRNVKKEVVAPAKKEEPEKSSDSAWSVVASKDTVSKKPVRRGRPPKSTPAV
jgi:cold shock CspA family protein